MSFFDSELNWPFEDNENLVFFPRDSVDKMTQTEEPAPVNPALQQPEGPAAQQHEKVDWSFPYMLAPKHFKGKVIDLSREGVGGG